MVRLLVGGDLGGSGGAKKRRVPDRITCTRAMLRKAVMVEALDIVQYLLERGVAPDMQTVQLLHSNRV